MVEGLFFYFPLSNCDVNSWEINTSKFCDDKTDQWDLELIFTVAGKCNEMKQAPVKLLA